MLARVKNLSAPIKMQRMEIWSLEKEAMDLHERFLQSSIESEQMIDFSDLIVGGFMSSGTLETKLKEIKSPSDRSAALADFKKILSSYKSLISKLTDSVEAWDKDKNKLVKDHLNAIKNEVDKIVDVSERIKAIAEFDGAVVLKTQIRLLENIIRVNEGELIAFWKDKTGVNMPGFFAHYEGNVKKFFEKFIMQNREGITEERLFPEVEKVIGELCVALNNSLRSSQIGGEDLDAFKAFLRTHFFAICARDVYKETDRIQGSKSAKIGFAATASINKVIHPYVCLPMLAKLINVSDVTQTLFHELSVWAKGVYVRSLDCLPPFVKTKEGGLKPLAFKYFGDSEDRDLRMVLKTANKIAISSNHLPLAEAISLKLPAALRLPIEREVASDVSAAQAALVEDASPVAAGAGSVAQADNLDQRTPLPLSELESILQDIEKKDRSSGCFAQLAFVVRIYKLNEAQVGMLNYYKGTIISNLERYLTAKDRTTFKKFRLFVPTNTRFTPRVNAETVTNLISELGRVDLTAQKMIDLMHGALNDLNAADSKDAVKIVRDGLIQACKFLQHYSGNGVQPAPLRM